MIVYISTYLIWLTCTLLLNQNRQIAFRIYPLSFVIFGWSNFVWYLIYTFGTLLTLVRIFLFGKHVSQSHFHSILGIVLTLLPLCFVKTSLILPYHRRDMELYHNPLTQLTSGGYVQAIHHYVFHSHNIHGIVHHFKGEHIEYPFQFDVVLTVHHDSSITLRGLAKSLECLCVTSLTGSGEFSCLNGCQGVDVHSSDENLYLVTQ